MEQHYFLKMYDYDAWANKRALASLNEAETPPQKALRIFDHILGAATVWQNRLSGKDSDQFKIWPDYRAEERDSRIEEVFYNWKTYLQSLAPEQFTQKVSYRNSKGTPFETEIADILSHVIVHGGYHRGQIAALLRDSGATPAVTDFIYYIRNQ